MMMGGFPRGVSGPKTRGAAGLQEVWPRDFPGAPFATVHSIVVHVQLMCVQHSTFVCSTVVQHLCVRYNGTAPMCPVQWYSTSVYGTVVQHLCVRYSGTVPVCAVQWCSTRVGSKAVQHLCVHCTTQSTNFERQVAHCASKQPVILIEQAAQD